MEERQTLRQATKLWQEAYRYQMEGAASIASLLLTTEALITDIPEEKSAAVPAMPHGDMY